MKNLLEMSLTIRDDVALKEVQESFIAAFPYLKIEFFSKPRGIGQNSLPSHAIDAGKTIGECRQIHNSGTLNLEGSVRVYELELSLWLHYGLHAQVFKKMGYVWLETTFTDYWTLKEQNEDAAAVCKQMIN